MVALTHWWPGKLIFPLLVLDIAKGSVTIITCDWLQHTVTLTNTRRGQDRPTPGLCPFPTTMHVLPVLVKTRPWTQTYASDHIFSQLVPLPVFHA